MNGAPVVVKRRIFSESFSRKYLFQRASLDPAFKYGGCREASRSLKGQSGTKVKSIILAVKVCGVFLVFNIYIPVTDKN